ncbi:HipA N-terminal domain protein [Shewanella baltica OS195]|uniref:HipA N-terminal domain protein n=1 Tax=Shewanella baltica (strain OS195) TaxID=399599 RepID=A9L033_SHEB9|nr:type II toxin-antitoxin system HipA family toxin [Shewanella baltica]ABX50641.1 HipA N-terminal domain protein [Shewanella baltica OS195]ADT95633.1 HipA N-terminal domain protein [Shewanella baltica OS678]
MKPAESVEALALYLNHQRIAILTHYSGGKNILKFDPEYIAMPKALRPTLTLTQLLDPHYIDKIQVRTQRLSPVLSNLLPEGALRHWMSAALKVHENNEFPILAWAGNNLPGGLIASAIAKEDIPAWALSPRERTEAIVIDITHTSNKFSLAGVQMKFSTSRNDGRFNINADQDGQDSWIIKTPSTVHRNVPQNEYTAMKLAQIIGVNIPEIELISLNALDNLPNIKLPDEPTAYAIKRFDRSDTGRIHAEDFAQIFEVYAHDKYGKYNYEAIAKALYMSSYNGLKDVQQMARRLLANILLANGDAHLKNWSVIYPDNQNAILSPAYDIVSTLPYIEGETAIALNINKQKLWYAIDITTFQAWATRTGIPWPAIKVHLLDAMQKARTLWPEALAELPMHEVHKTILKAHWAKLHNDFKILC